MLRQNFWAKFYRKFHFSFTPWGILFYYKGDQVEWMYPWKRTNMSRPYLSSAFGVTLKSLKELDDLWDGYEEACRKGL